MSHPLLPIICEIQNDSAADPLQTKFQSVTKFSPIAVHVQRNILFLIFCKSNELGTESTSTKWRENDIILIPEDATQRKGNSLQYHDSKFCIVKFFKTGLGTILSKWRLFP